MSKIAETVEDLRTIENITNDVQQQLDGKELGA